MSTGSDLDFFFHYIFQISFFGGIILNEGVNWVLKHILREPRPCAGEQSNVTMQGVGRAG